MGPKKVPSRMGERNLKSIQRNILEQWYIQKLGLIATEKSFFGESIIGVRTNIFW